MQPFLPARPRSPVLTYNIGWEHVVSAKNFGGTFVSGPAGTPDCGKKEPGRIPAFSHPVSRIRKYSRLPSICSRYIPTSTLWVGIPSFGCRKSPALSLPVTKERYASIQHGQGSWQGWHRSKPL